MHSRYAAHPHQACVSHLYIRKTYITLGIQRIMLNLREKAHASLSAHRNTPPSRQGTLSEPSTPADDNDELSTLGGRTRLVAQKEKSVSPTMGVLIPPQPRMTVPSAKSGAAYTYTTSLIYGETRSPRLGDVSSPDGTPAPQGEPSYLEYPYAPSWPQSDVRSAPHVQPPYGAGAAAEPRYIAAFRDRIPPAAAAYTYSL